MVNGERNAITEFHTKLANPLLSNYRHKSGGGSVFQLNNLYFYQKEKSSVIY